MQTAELVVISLAVAPVLLTVGACLRARRNRVAQAEAVLESPRWSIVGTSVCALVMLVLVMIAMSLHPPSNALDYLSFIAILVATAVGTSVVCNKRLVVIGDRIIDVSMTGRRREVVLSGPARFEPVPLGWRLRMAQQSVFIPGYRLMGDTKTSVRQVDAFKEFVIARAERSVSQAVMRIDA